MDYEYIRYLMLYTDQKYPFEMAKSDPGLAEGLRSVNTYMAKNGRRKLTDAEAGRILMTERTIRRQVRDIDRDYEPGDQAPVAAQPPQKTQADLESELALLRKAIQEKEAELRNSAVHKISSPTQTKGDSGIIERNLKDTGYSDKIN